VLVVNYRLGIGYGYEFHKPAAGDFHGVHDWTVNLSQNGMADKYEKAPDYELALKTAWRASPVSAIAGWTSPVMIIHADDDRNVRFNKSVDLIKRLEKKAVPMETLMIVDDTHHWMKFANSITVYQEMANYFNKTLKK